MTTKRSALVANLVNPKQMARVFTGTWCGGHAEQTTHYANSNALGFRVTVHKWTESGVVEIRAIRGDGRTPSFVKHAEVVMTNPTQAEIDQVVRDLASKHLVTAL